MAKILVLGGSYLQSDFVDVACAENHSVHVIDRNAKCYLSTQKDIDFYKIDIGNLADVDKFFIRHSFDMIVSPITEIGNKVSSQIARKHNLLYNSLDAVSATTDKWLMRDALKSTKLDEPKVLRLREGEKLEKLDIEFPFIVKPTVSSASRGVTKVKDLKELHDAIERALPYCKTINNIILEEFIEGEQFSIETITSKGKHHVLGIVREHLSGSPHFMERFDVLDKYYNFLVIDNIQSFVNELLNALDIQYGPCHIEVKIDEFLNVRLIEIASRSGLLRDRLLRASGGENYNKHIIDTYLGNTIGKTELPTSNGCLGMVAYEDDLKCYNRAKKDNLITDSYFYPNYSFVKNPTMLTDVAGYFFIKSKDVSVFNKYKVRL
jgi:carbamoylphosphate synthase large subunit